MEEQKYEFMKVGTTRHPETYTEDRLIARAFHTVEEELAMWKSAETIVEAFKDGQFTVQQQWFIWHYVNHLLGRDNLEELQWMEFMKFRLYFSRGEDFRKRLAEEGEKK